jgi:arylsulfatase
MMALDFSWPKLGALAAALLFGAAAMPTPAQAQAPARKPNILVIMGDDVGWFNIGAYHRGMMSGKTPNLDKLAADGMMFTDYYAEASCTAGRRAGWCRCRTTRSGRDARHRLEGARL